MRKNLQHLIFRFTITILLLVVLISGTLNQKTYASESGPKLEFWFEIAGKQTLEFSEFEQELYEDYNHDWSGMIDLVEIQLKVKSLTGEPVRLSAIDFDIDRNEFISNVYKVDSSSLIIENPASPKRWDVPQISSDNKKVYFIWNGPSTLDDFNEYVPVEGILVGSIKLEIDSDNLPNDFFISPTIDLKGTFDDTGDLVYIDSNGVQQKYYNEDFIFKSLQVGDLDSGPDASLSSLKVEGESTTYLNLTNDIEVDPFIHEVTVSYADNKIENGIAIIASPKKAGADVQMSGIKSSYTTGDIITIQVTDDSDTKTYKIKINVTEANDDTSVTFTTNKPSSVKSQGFNGTNSYDITVDFNTLEIQVIPNIHELSTVDETSLNFTNLQPGETRSLTVWVTSEAGTNNEYTVNVTREVGNSDTSFEVDINGQSITKEENTYFKPLIESVDRFTFTISGFESTTKIYYKLGKHTGVDISDYQVLPSNKTLSNLLVQKNEKVIYTLLAVAQDGTKELSYIEVERAPSTNVDLSKVTINEVAGSTSHTQDITRINSLYSYTVKDNSSDRIIFLVTGINGEGQFIEILDENNLSVTEVATSNLNVGDNNYIIRVTAQNGTASRDFNLVIKKLSDQKEITKIELLNNDDGTLIAFGIGGENGFTYDSANNRYSFTLAYGQATNFELILTTSEKSIIFVGQSQSSNNTRVFSGTFNSLTLQNREFTNITIKAENGSVSSAFDIRITRAAADTNNKLEDIQINGVTVNGFLPNKGDYSVTIFERDTISVFIEAFFPENSKATLEFYVNGSLEPGSNSINLYFTDNKAINVELKVTSESGVVFTYKVPVIAASDDSSIKNIQIYNASNNELVFNSFNQGTLEYNNITLPYSIETIKVVVTTTDDYATVMGIVANGTYVLNTTTPLNLTIFGKSEAGNESTQKYKFTIKRETPRSYKDLETLTVKYIDANNLEVIEELDVDASNNFTLRVDNHITPIQITATILGLQGERIVGSSTNTLILTENFTVQQKARTVNIIVVDESGQQKTYTITITRANNDKTFESVKIGNRTYGFDEFDSNNKLTLDDVFYDVDRLSILFNMIENSNSTIVSPTSFIGNNLEGIWYFNTQTGLITATFHVKSEYGESSSTFTIEIYRESALSLKSLNGLKISAGSKVLLEETNTVADSYDIRVDRTTSSVVIITTLPIIDRSSVMSPYQLEADESPNKVYTYTLTLNNPNASAATIHQITVQAEDGTTKTYVITIWRRNANISLDEVTIKHGELTLHTGTFETAYEYLGNFDYNVSELTFIIKPADINARISINNGQRLIPIDGVITTTIPLVVGENREINLKVESDITQDEMITEYLSKTYKFTYDKKAASNVAELDFLEAIVDGEDLLEGISLDFANENEFGDFVVNRDFTSVTISAKALNSGTVTGVGSRVLIVGRNQFIITVTSQSGTHSKDYILVIYRNNDNNDITDITIGEHTLDFQPEILTYDLGTILYDEDKLDIFVTLGDQVHAKYYINNVLSENQISLNYGLNTIKIQAESDYGTKGIIYTVTVFRESPYKDVELNDLIVYFDDDLNNLITYNANTFTYTLELNPQDTPTTLRVIPKLKNSFKQSISSANNLDDDILINYQDGEINQTIKFIVLAEDNSQQEYTIIIKKGNVKSGDYSINDVIITNTISSNNYILFDPTQYQYSFDVAYSINQLNIDINLNDSKSVITFVRRPSLLVMGDNLFEFFVTAENGEVGPTHKITVTRKQPSTDNELLEILISDPLNPGGYLLGLDGKNPLVEFDGRQTYTIILNEQYINEIITILFTKKVDAQIVTGDVNKQLIIDQKTKRFEINVKPEDPSGITKAYFINIEIKYEENSLTSLKIDDKTMNLSPPLISYTTLKSSVSIQTTLDNIYGDVIIKDNLGNIISGNTLNLEFDSNDYTIEVYSETGVLVETHILEIIREKHNDKDIIGVTLLGNDNTNYLPNFDESQLVYDIEVPINVSSVTLSANISPTAQLIGGGVYTIGLDETKSITFFVTAENGDKSNTYILNITKRSLSTINEIGEIRFRDPLDSTRYTLGLISKDPSYVFSPNVRDYTIELGLEYVGKQITVRYEKGDPYQTITGLVNGEAIELIRGTNVFKLTVYPEDIDNVDPLIYTVTINVKNKENSLESLKIDNQPIVFDSESPITYITENESAVVLVTPSNTDGMVTIRNLDGQVILSPLDLVVGENIYTIEVTNEFGQIVETYDLIIERSLSSNLEVFEATLTDNELTNYLLFDKDILHYEIFIPFEMNELQLMINAHMKSLIYIDDIHIVDGNMSYILTPGEMKTISFYVVAENGNIGSTYTLEVTKLKNTDDKLKELTILTNLDTLLSINDFDPENNYYAYQVNELHTHVTFSFLANYGQTVTGVTLDEAILLNHGLNVFEIHVQPEDLMLDPFIITIEIEVINSNIDLSELLVNGQDIYKTNKTEYRLDDVSSDTKVINIETILSDNYGSVKINGFETNEQDINLVPGENTITIEITSEDLSTIKTYTIIVNQLLDDLDTLEVLSVLTNLNNYLLGKETDNPQTIFDPTTNTYKFNVNEDIETIFIDFIIGSIKQQVSGPFNEYLNLEHGVNIFEFRVEPEDTNKPDRVYVVEINKTNDKIYVDQLLVNGKDIYEEGIFDYTIDSVTNDTKTIKVIPIFNNYATYEIFDANNNLVAGHDVTLNFGINNIKVIALSESGLYTETYTITIEQTYSDDNEIIDVRFFDASTNINRLNFDPDITTYDIEFPSTTNIARLRVETHNKALVFINGIQEVNTTKDFTIIAGNTITVSFYVVAEDGTKGIEYTINVYKRKETEPVLSDNTNLLDVTIEIPMDQVRFDFDPSIYEYTISIPYKYDEIYIKAHTENLGATVSNEGAYALNPGDTKVIRLRVTAEDGTVAQREYKFIITRALPNTDTTLKSLVIEDLSGNILTFDQAIFSPDNRIYNITLPESSNINRVNVIAEKNNDSQILYNTGIVNLHGEIEGYYNTIITITVVAEDGSVGEYIVYILHDLDFASIAEVKDISIIGNNGISYFGLDFENNVYEYDDIVVPFNVATTRLIVQTIGNIIYLDSNHTEIDDNRLQEFDISNKITYRFKIESTNKQYSSEVYTIHVTREKPDTNSLLEYLEINGEEIRGFNPNTYEYNYIHPLQFENYVDVYGLAQSRNSIVRGNDIYTLFDGQTRTINIEVTAESGDTTTYKIHISYVNSNALLGELIVYEMIGDNEIENAVPLKDDTLEYIIIIGRDTKYVNIKGYAKDQGGASIRGFGVREVGTEDNIVEITVTSGDSLEEITYLITLRRDTSLSDLKEITLLRINDKDNIKTNDDDPYVYTYNLSNSTNTVKLSAISNNNAKVSINGSEYSSNNICETVITDVTESQVIRISVMAEDGSIQHYMVVINKDPEPSILLTILLILSIILWFITAMILILRRIKRHNKKDESQLIY